jgi:hypothetical protein
MAKCLTRRLGIAAFGIAIVSSNPSFADDRTSLSTTLVGEARASYEAARLLYNDGDNAGALTKFKRAYDLSKDPRLLWNMAASEKALRHYARAASLITRYLSEAEGKLTPQNVANAVETQKALRAFYSVVNLTGVPASARVLVDGTPAVESPLALDLGEHSIRVEREGFEPFATTVTVPGNTPVNVAVVLTATRAAPGRLVISAHAGDLVAVDRNAATAGRWEGALPAGEHVVRVTADGKKPYETKVALLSGETKTVQVSLEEEPRGSLWPWIVGGTVLVGGAVVGGYFLFKPKDEPGQPPVGKLGTVPLPASVRW